MRLSWDQLESLLDELDNGLFKDELNRSEYVKEWDELMVFAGWTWHDFISEVDRRWVPEKRARHALSSC